MMNLIYILIGLLICLKLFYHKSIIKKNAVFEVKGYNVCYQDSKSDDEEIIESRLLHNEQYDIKGKPDFILKHNNKELYIPVELKSGKIGENESPHKGDFLQLITYFLLIEEEFSSKPKYGKIIYNDYMFIVKNKNKFRKQLIVVLRDMRNMLKNGKCKKIEPSFNKCRYCLCNNTVCEVKK